MTGEARLHGVFMATGIGGAAPVVVLEVNNDQYLPIFIGFFEAISIYQAMNHTTSPRPLTHDLFVSLFERLGVTLLRVNIDSLEEGVFYATLVVEVDECEERLDCRPSDGIAIAVRVQAPIWVDPVLIVAAGVPKEGLPDLSDLTVFLNSSQGG